MKSVTPKKLSEAELTEQVKQMLTTFTRTEPYISNTAWHIIDLVRRNTVTEATPDA